MRLSNSEVLLAWPLARHILTQGWYYNGGGLHQAIDLRATVGTPVFAAEPGTVDWVQTWDGRTRTGMQSYGNGVRIKHADYAGKSLQTRYAHLDKLCVQPGQQVQEGQLIGYSGETGNCYGAHLHFEVIWGGVRRNPLVWMDDDFTTASSGVYTYGALEHAVERPGEETGKGILGVDVSKYQGEVDWKKVAATGVKFAILRAGSCNNDGPYIDPTFERNYKGARAAGLKVGAYMYTYAQTEESQNAELAVWLPALEGKSFEYPVFVDVEQRGVPTELVKRMMNILDQKGFTPGWYTYTNFLQNLDVDALKDYPLWLADYREAPGYKGEYVMWQYTSSGSVDGIGGRVDMNYSYKNYGASKPEAPTHQKIRLDPVVVTNAEAMEWYELAKKYGFDEDRAYHARYV